MQLYLIEFGSVTLGDKNQEWAFQPDGSSEYQHYESHQHLLDTWDKYSEAVWLSDEVSVDGTYVEIDQATRTTLIESPEHFARVQPDWEEWGWDSIEEAMENA